MESERAGEGVGDLGSCRSWCHRGGRCEGARESEWDRDREQLREKRERTSEGTRQKQMRWQIRASLPPLLSFVVQG